MQEEETSRGSLIICVGAFVLGLVFLIPGLFLLLFTLRNFDDSNHGIPVYILFGVPGLIVTGFGATLLYLARRCWQDDRNDELEIRFR